MQTDQDVLPPLEVLAFTLGGEEYGVDIRKVQELRSYAAVTRIAYSPDFIKGVVNLRGRIVPIVDMRIRFGLGAPRYDEFTVVIVLNLAGRVVGMVVDDVSDVIALSWRQIRPMPKIGVALDAGYLAGIGVVDPRMLILMDIDKLMSGIGLGLGEPAPHSSSRAPRFAQKDKPAATAEVSAGTARRSIFW